MAQVPKQVSECDAKEPAPLRPRLHSRAAVEPVPTPLRRRSESPGEVSSRGDQKAKPQVHQAEATHGAHLRRGLGLLAGVAMLAAGLRPTLWPKSASMTSSQVPSVSTVEQEVDGRTQVEPRLPSLLQKAMACPGLKADILDVVAGAPYEFAVHGNVEDHEGFFRLPRLAAAAQNGKDKELQKVVLQIAATGGGWPLQLQERLLQLLNTPCEARNCLFAPAPVVSEVDERFTSPRAVSGGWLHQAFLTMGSITGLPTLRARAELYRSLPPSVMLSNASITQMRDCFAFRGVKKTPPSVALRFRVPSVVQQLVIEQPPRWAALRPDSLPRRFSVYGAYEVDVSNPYTKKLGNFTYSAAGPAVQAFHLAPLQTPLTGLRLVFEDSETEKHYICLYRLKLFEEATETACSNGRAAWRLQSNE